MSLCESIADEVAQQGAVVQPMIAEYPLLDIIEHIALKTDRTAMIM